jgi:hypothetical protein
VLLQGAFLKQLSASEFWESSCDWTISGHIRVMVASDFWLCVYFFNLFLFKNHSGKSNPILARQLTCYFTFSF